MSRRPPHRMGFGTCLVLVAIWAIAMYFLLPILAGK